MLSAHIVLFLQILNCLSRSVMKRGVQCLNSKSADVFGSLYRAKLFCKNSSWSLWLITYGFRPGSSHQVFWCVLSRGQDCLPDSHSNSSTLVWSLSPWEQQHRRHSDFQTNSDSAAKCSKSGHYWWKEAGLPVKLSDGLTTSTSLCLTRSLFSKDVLDKVVTRSFCMVNPSRAGSNYRLHWASRMQQTLTAPFFEGSFFFFLRKKMNAKTSREWFCGVQWAARMSEPSPNLLLTHFNETRSTA